jgi:nucleoside diphosphate kinase
MSAMVRDRVLHARTSSLSIRYGQSRQARLCTDQLLIWAASDQALLLLLDTNLLEPGEADALRKVLQEWLEPQAGESLDLAGCYRAGHAVVSDWLTQQGVAARRRFVSAGLIQTDGPEVSYIGAYSPIYLHSPGGLEQRVFDGPMWGAPTSAGYPGRTGSVWLRPEQSLLVLSDGMLESRDRTGRINGDSVLYALAVNDSVDLLEAVLAAYRDVDAERIDNHGLLVMQPAAHPATGATQRTLLLFKPDVYELGLGDDILARVEALGLRTLERFQVQFPPQGIFALWPRIYGRRWIESLQQAMPSRPLDVFVLEGVEAIPRLIEFKDKLRTERAPVNSYRNLLHSPDSPAAVRREYAYLTTIRVRA